MPRFLAVNYLQEAVVQQKLLLDRMLISVPDRFEESHSSETKRFFIDHWSEVEKFQVTLQDHRDDWKDLQKCSLVSKLENYQSEVIFHQTAYGSFELVPSSNPNSQESIDDSILLRLCDEVGPQTGVETFNKESLDNLADISGLLEETLEINQLNSYLENQISVKELVKKIKLKVVRDPFVTQDGKDISEEHIFREDLQYESGLEKSELNHQENLSHTKEPFYKETLVDVQRDSIEENLIAYQAEKASSVERKLDVMPKDILKSLQIENTSESLNTTDALQQLNVYGEELRKADIFVSRDRNEQCDSNVWSNPVEHVTESPKHERINSEALFESPEEMTAVSDYESSGVFTPWEKALPFSILLSDPSDKDFLPEQKKAELHNRLVHQEIVLNDMLTFTLPVPSASVKRAECHISKAKEKLSLLEEECPAELELALSWDFISSSEQVMEKSLKKCLGFTREPAALEQKSIHPLQFDQESLDEDDFSIAMTEIDGFNDELKMPKPNTENAIHEPSLARPSNGKETCEKEMSKESAKWRDEALQYAIKEINPIDGFIFIRRNTFTTTPTSKHLSEKGKPSDVSPDIDNEMFVSEEIDEAFNNKLQEASFTSPTVDSTLVETYSKVDFTPERYCTKKSKMKVMEVAFTGMFMKVVQVLEDSAEPFLSLLQLSGLIPRSQTFTMFTPEVSRFIMTQHEKVIKERGDSDISNDKTFQAVVVLHILVSSLDSFLHGCLHSSIMTLGSLQEKYETVLKGVMGDIRQQLFEWNHKIQQRNILHPKLSHLCEALAQWYVRKVSKSPDQDVKILIVCKNPDEHLLKEVADCVAQIEGISSLPETAREELSSQNIINSLDQANCLVVCQKQIGEHFPWAQFSLVMEYSYTPLSKIMEACTRQSIRYIGLNLKSWQSEPQSEITGDAIEVGNMKTTNLNPESLKKQIVVIGSERLTAKCELLHFLETRNNIAVIERDYSHLNIGQEFADVIIDERTCVLLIDLTEFKGCVDMQPMTDRITAMGIKYQMCWVILLSSAEEEKSGYSYSGNTVVNLSNLQARIPNSRENYSVKVLHCRNYNDAAQLIRMVSEDAMNRSVTENICKEEAWLNRSWLTPDISKKERSLLSFPSLNSFSIQLMLTECPFDSLLKSSAQELIKRFTWLQPHVIEMFVDMVNKNVKLSHKDSKQKRKVENGSYGSSLDFCSERFESQFQPDDVDNTPLETNRFPLNSEKLTAKGNAFLKDTGREQREDLNFPGFDLINDRRGQVARHTQGREIHQALQTPLEFLNSRVKIDESSSLYEKSRAFDQFTTGRCQHAFPQPLSMDSDDIFGKTNSEFTMTQKNANAKGVLQDTSDLWQEFGRNPSIRSKTSHSDLGYSKESCSKGEDCQREEESFQKIFQDVRTKTPSIAPVTPRVRQPRQFQTENINSSSACYFSVKQSPPMDYDSDDEYDMSVHMQPISYIASPACTEQNNSQCGFQSREIVSEINMYNQDSDVQRWGWSTRGSLTPNKQRRLTYEAVPGSMSGQTRLRFQ